MDATTALLVQVTPRVLVILDPATPYPELGQRLHGLVNGGRRQVYLAVARGQAERRLAAELTRLHGWGALAGGRVVGADAGRALLRLLRDGPSCTRVLLATTTLRADRVRSLIRTVRRRHGIAVMVHEPVPAAAARLRGAP